MQRKDVDDRVILAGIAVACALNDRVRPLGNAPWSSCSRWDLDLVLSGLPERVGVGPYDGYASWLPYKLLMAKLEHMKRRGLIDGCTCGCRGDFTILDKGRATSAEWMPVVRAVLE